MARDWSNKIFHLTLHASQGRKIKGKAIITEGLSGVRVTMEFDTNDGDLIAELLEEGVTEPEIGQEYHISEVEKRAVERFNKHDHNPVAHGDNKPKWCDICGLTASLKLPKSYRGASPPKSNGDYNLDLDRFPKKMD